MNFVISHEQTSQSGTNPVILRPSLSGRGRRRRRPGSAEAQPGNGASAGATAAAHRRRAEGPAAGTRCPTAPPGTGVGVSRGTARPRIRGPSSTSPKNERWSREAERSDGLGNRRGGLHLSWGVTRGGPEVEAGRGGTVRTSLGKGGGTASMAATWLPGGWVSFFAFIFHSPK